MKKIKCSLFVLLLCNMLIRPANAIWPDFTPVIPVAPQICAMCTPSAIQTYMGMYKQVKSMNLAELQNSVMSQVKQFAQQYAINLAGSMMGKLTGKKKVVSYARTIKAGKMVSDIENKQQVHDAFKALFLKYPQKSSASQAAYRKKGEQFKIDTTLEMLITAREMEKEIDQMVEELENVEKCLVGGEGCNNSGMEQFNCQKSSGDASTEDELCLWRNDLHVTRIYDKIMRYNEMLLAMKAQYEAVLNINTRAKIEISDEEMKNDAEAEKQSSAFDIKNEKTVLASSQSMTVTLAFAEESGDDSDDEIIAKNTGGSRYDFDYPSDAGVVSPLAGKEIDFKSLETLNEAQEKLNISMNAHNLKQNLGRYRKIFETYNNMRDYYKNALNNLKVSAKCSSDFVGTYYQNSIESWIGDRCVSKKDIESSGGGMESLEGREKSTSPTSTGSEIDIPDDSYLCHYEHEKSSSDKSPSKGLYDLFCPGDPKHKCYVTNSYGSTTGIAALLIGRYERKQEELALEDSNSDGIFMSTKVDYENGSSGGMSDVSGKGNQAYDSYKNGESSNQNLKDPSLEEALKKASRENALINWSLGSGVVKDIIDSIASNKPLFGTPKGKVPLWNDQKYFYDLYITSKYDNIKEYVRTMPLHLANLNIASQLNKDYPYTNSYDSHHRITKTAEQKRQEADQKIKTLVTIATNVSEDTSELDNLLQKEQKVLGNIISEHESRKESNKYKLHQYYEQLAAINERVSELREDFSKNKGVVVESENYKEKSQEGFEFGEDMYKGTGRSSNGSKQAKDFNSTKEDSIKNKDTALKALAPIESQLANAENGMKQLEALIKATKAAIEEERKGYIKDYTKKQQEFREAIDTLVEDYNEARGNDEITNSIKAAAVSEITPTVAVSNLIINAIRRYAVKCVDEAIAELNALRSGNQLYYAANYSKVYKIHENMFDKIVNISIDDLLAFDKELRDFPGINNLLKNIQSALPNIIQTGLANEAGSDYKEADDEYFVGIVVRKRDLRAPKSAIDFASAPLREIFHFDLDDFNNIDKYYKDAKDLNDYKKLMIIGYSILDVNNGLNIPEIWHYILKPRAFVEKEIDLNDFLNRGNPGMNYIRSGIYPCKYDGSNIDAVNPTSGKFGYKKDVKDLSSYKDIPQCTVFGVTKNALRDKQARAKVKFYNIDSGSPVVGSSELGTLITTVEDEPLIKYIGLTMKIYPRYKLSFRPEVVTAISKINETENLGEGDDGTDEDLRYYLLSRSLLDRNQLGDYLDQMEVEKHTLATLDGLGFQLNSIRSSIIEALNIDGSNNELREDFDLTNEEDYKEISKYFEDMKNNYLKQAKSLFEKVTGTTTALTEKKKKVKHNIDVLEYDKDEYVQVEGSEDLDELKDKIDNSKADLAVETVAHSVGGSKLRDAGEGLQPPYCAIYPIN